MPYSFTQIEKEKNSTIGFVFSFLLLFYFLTGWCIAVIAKNYLILESSQQNSQYSFSLLTGEETFTTLMIAVFIGLGHWFFSVQSLVRNILKVLNAEPLNPDDTYHQMFRNIIEEVSVATGGKKIEAVVVPVPAMNAFAIADFQGNAVIGVTEGLLARLNRAQLEAVVGHEAAHIISGDCLSTTVTTSLFALYNGLLNGISIALRGSRSSSRERGGGVIGFLIFIYLLLMVTRFVSLLFRMFISREREYRADAISARLTRDPLSLAQALYAISFRWRGSGLAGEELEAIFITNPCYSNLDEQNGFFSDLFSTHPPTEKRIKILLDMAHSNLQSLEDSFKSSSNPVRQEVPSAVPAQETQWMVSEGGNWMGPYTIGQLATISGLKPESWVKRIGGSVVQACDDRQVLNMLQAKQPSEESSDDMCPCCHLPLSIVSYEGIPIQKCSHCGGVLVQETDVQRILVRKEVGFSERIQKLAAVIENSPQNWFQPQSNLKTAPLFPCPKCSAPKPKMIRMFYTLAYPVEIDKCMSCGYIWFDRDELEVLQYLIENNVNKEAA